MNRHEHETCVKVYSNLPEVTLYVNGEAVETKTAHHVFDFRIPLNGEVKLCAKAGEKTDETVIRYVETPDMSYVLNKEAAAVTNWFDAEELDPDYYSVNDTMGDIAKNPEAGAMLEQMMGKMAASRGDVANSVKDNPALKKMMARMTLASLLKQAGDVKPETVQQLNRILQRFKKVK